MLSIKALAPMVEYIHYPEDVELREGKAYLIKNGKEEIIPCKNVKI